MNQYGFIVAPAAIVNHFHFNTMCHGPLDWVRMRVWVCVSIVYDSVNVCVRDGIVFVTKYNHKRNLIAPNRVCHVLASHRYRYKYTKAHYWRETHTHRQAWRYTRLEALTTETVIIIQFNSASHSVIMSIQCCKYVANRLRLAKSNDHLFGTRIPPVYFCVCLPGIDFAIQARHVPWLSVSSQNYFLLN